MQDFGRLSIANSVALAGQKIVVGGQQRNDLQTTNVLAARFNANGSPDGSFGGNAGLPGLFVQQYARGAAYSAAFEVGVDSAGRVVLAGAATNGSADPEGADAIVVRLRGNGTPDPAFSGDGIAYLPATTDKDQFTKQEPFPGASGMALVGNRVILGGYFDSLAQKQLAVWALQENGALNGSFGTGGRTVTAAGQQRRAARRRDRRPTATSSGSAATRRTSSTRRRGLAAKYAGIGAAPGRSQVPGQAGDDRRRRQPQRPARDPEARRDRRPRRQRPVDRPAAATTCSAAAAARTRCSAAAARTILLGGGAAATCCEAAAVATGWLAARAGTSNASRRARQPPSERGRPGRRAPSRGSGPHYSPCSNA